MRKAMRPTPLAGLISLLLLAGCGDAGKPGATPAGNAPFETRFLLGVSGKKLHTRVAITDLELATGLMGASSLPDDEGMAFVYRKPQRLNFWMANVPFDIDIGFFDGAGRLCDIHRLRANDTDPVASDTDTVRYALETPPGWFAVRGLKPGAHLDLTELTSAIESRGFRAKDFVPAK